PVALCGPADLFPELFASAALTGGIRKHPRPAVFVVQGLQRALKLIAGNTVAFCRHDQELAPEWLQKFHQLLIALLRWNIPIYEHQAKRQARPFPQVRFNKAGPTLRNLPGHTRVTISWQVRKNQFRARISRPSQFEEIDRSRAARS